MVTAKVDSTDQAVPSYVNVRVHYFNFVAIFIYSFSLSPLSFLFIFIYFFFNPFDPLISYSI